MPKYKRSRIVKLVDIVICCHNCEHLNFRRGYVDNFDNLYMWEKENINCDNCGYIIHEEDAIEIKEAKPG